MNRRKAKVVVLTVVGGLLVLLLLTKLTFVIIALLTPYHLPRADWTFFQKNFLSKDGRVVDTGNHDVSHSEGQGYGLLIAVAYEDRKTFDRIWEWTRKNLQTRPNDKLLSWQWTPDGKGGGAVSDPNNASDGDLLVAWALVRASKLWEEYSYQQAASQILIDLARLDLKEGADGLYLLPGTDGFVQGDSFTVNPSYYLFPAFREIGQAFPNSPWEKLGQTGHQLIEQARFGKWKLAPDWATVKGETVELAPNFPPLFGYNAVRVPLNLAWENPRSPLLESYAAFWKSFSTDKIPATVDLSDDALGHDPALPGMRVIATFTLACSQKRNLTVRSIPELTKGEPYFSASLTLLTKIAVRDCFAKK